jgi:LmbE family N-acetylglucosaminyl deacetylase
MKTWRRFRLTARRAFKLKIAATLLAVWLLNAYLISDYSRQINSRPLPLYRLGAPRTVLILAAHQDDAVIQAGGIAIHNQRLGGHTHIAYLTAPSDSALCAARKAEAHRAWALAGEERISLWFLDFPDDGAWGERMQHQARDSIAAIVQRLNPDIAVIPLLEQGHWQHDLLHVLAREALDTLPGIEVLQAAEYNPYFLMRQSPEKTLMFLMRLAPFLPYAEKSYGLIRANQQTVALSEGEIEIKKRMLREFDSQYRVIPVHQFGYPDLFESTEQPPESVIAIGQKYFSPWALATLALTAALIVVAGALAADFLGGGVLAVAIAGALGLALAGGYLIVGRRFFVEEMLLITLLAMGFCGETALGSRARRRVRRNR